MKYLILYYNKTKLSSFLLQLLIIIM